MWENVGDWTIIIEERWQNNIGDGILCWVSFTEDMRDKALMIVTGYSPELTCKYSTKDGGTYIFAIPATVENVKKYIYDSTPYVRL